jgi:hypothetical protein
LIALLNFEEIGDEVFLHRFQIVQSEVDPFLIVLEANETFDPSLVEFGFEVGLNDIERSYDLPSHSFLPRAGTNCIVDSPVAVRILKGETFTRPFPNVETAFDSTQL